MRNNLIALAFVAVAGAASAQTPSTPNPLPATDVTAASIKQFIDALPKDAISDRPIRIVDVGGPRVGVYGVFRPKSLPGDAIAHETLTTEVYYMLEGNATLVTGGTITGLKKGPEGNSGPRGDKIVGGVSRRVVPGDVIIIPGRTPHWWSSMDGDIRYMIIRADSEGKRLQLK
jgi:mannose-6-phosphate isomerase-like protein (cupin superfamily)